MQGSLRNHFIHPVQATLHTYKLCKGASGVAIVDLPFSFHPHSLEEKNRYMKTIREKVRKKPRCQVLNLLHFKT